MYMTPGTSFVYLTYGMYYCMNISSKGDGAAVLLRSLEPLEGIEEMTELRTSKFFFCVSKHYFDLLFNLNLLLLYMYYILH